MTDSNLLTFTREATFTPDSVRVIADTAPYDHCNMTAGPDADPDAVGRFADLLLRMSYADPTVRPLLDLEGLHQWLPGRVSGYEALSRAVDESRLLRREWKRHCRRLPTLSSSASTPAGTC